MLSASTGPAVCAAVLQQQILLQRSFWALPARGVALPPAFELSVSVSRVCCWQDDPLGAKTILEPLTSALHIEPPGRITALAKSSFLKQQTFISHFFTA